MATQKTLNTSFGLISYLEANPKKEETLFFIHGNSHSKSSFSNQLSSPRFDNFRLIALDLPGHGASCHLENYSLSLYYELLCEFILSFNIENYILIGHSLGGHIAIEALESLNPRGLILLGTPPLSHQDIQTNPFIESAELQLLFQDDLSPLELDRLARSFYHKAPLNLIQTQVDIKNTDKQVKKSLQECLQKQDFKDEVNILKSTLIPTAIFHGEYDQYINLNYLKIIDLNLWNNEIQLFKTGHNIHVEDSWNFNYRLHEFALDVFNLSQPNMYHSMTKTNTTFTQTSI